MFEVILIFEGFFIFEASYLKYFFKNVPQLPLYAAFGSLLFHFGTVSGGVRAILVKLQLQLSTGIEVSNIL